MVASDDASADLIDFDDESASAVSTLPILQKRVPAAHLSAVFPAGFD